MASAAAAVVTDAEIQTDVKVIGRAYALQAAQFDSFYPRFVVALDVASRRQSGSWEAAKFLADSQFRFFASFAKGILRGVMSGPAVTATSTRWRLRRSTHIGGMATDHDATARAARSSHRALRSGASGAQ